MSETRPSRPLGDVRDASDITVGGMRLSLIVETTASAAAREEFLAWFDVESRRLMGLQDPTAFATLTDALAGELMDELPMPADGAEMLAALNDHYLGKLVAELDELGSVDPPIAERGFLALDSAKGLYCYIGGLRFCYDSFAISSAPGSSEPLTHTGPDGSTAILAVTCSGLAAR